MTNDSNNYSTAQAAGQVPLGGFRGFYCNKTRTYEYHIEDHLGNVRVAFEPENNNKITQKNDYYPFGMQIQYNQFEAPGTNKYLYNGKEMQDEFGLDWYDYGARFYDAEIGRWHVVDPMAEKYYSFSPYHYAGNNPIKYLDVDGRYFDKRNQRKAKRIARRAQRKSRRLTKKAARYDKRGKNSKDLRARAHELNTSVQDIYSMWNDGDVEYKYANKNSKRNSEAKGNPSIYQTGTNNKGDKVVTMFTERNMGSKLHEGRHGGDIARKILKQNNSGGYGVSHEVSAYRAQYSWKGKLSYDPVVNYDNIINLLTLNKDRGAQNFKVTVKNINDINANIINNMVDDPGLMQKKIYPPEAIPLNIWNDN